MALRQLRRFAREGSEEELDITDTISSTARNAGILDVKMVPERKNAAKVLLFLDVGGSMDPYVKICEQLFSAARSEFKHLEHFYFHNFLYESVWKDNNMRANVRLPTQQVMNTYGADHKLVFVGDATMTHMKLWLEEALSIGMKRLEQLGSLDSLLFFLTAVAQPQPEQYLGNIPSIGMVKELVTDRMFPYR